jgi:hypothetical protein
MTVVPIIVMDWGVISTHDAAVLTKVNGFIDTAYAKHQTVTETLDAAQAIAEGARQGPHDLVGRDAEYYLKCRHQVSKQEHMVTAVPVAIGGNVLNLFYNGIKAVLIGAGFEEQIRTDKDVPVTPPGGIWWGHKGCVDGLSDNGKVKEKPKPARMVAGPTYLLPTGSLGPPMA